MSINLLEDFGINSITLIFLRDGSKKSGKKSDMLDLGGVVGILAGNQLYELTGEGNDDEEEVKQERAL